jgi:hypothetical protein
MTQFSFGWILSLNWLSQKWGQVQRENSFLRVYKDETVDITHESLIWKWKRLCNWVEIEAMSAELYGDHDYATSGKVPLRKASIVET